MIRLFNQHVVREQKEIEGLFDFAILGNENKLPKEYSEKMIVPGCWESNIKWRSYRGKAAYKREIDILEDGNYKLTFKGVAHHATIYFNGEKVKYHYGAYTEFHVLLINIKKGKHVLEVVVSNEFDDSSSLHIPNDYYGYGGIIKPIVIEKLQDVYINNINIDTIKDNDNWKLNIEAFITNVSKKDVMVNLINELVTTKYIKSIKDICIKSSEKKKVCFSIDCKNIDIWDVDNPKLYLNNMQITDENNVLIDDFIERIGFRTLEVKDRKLLLNEKPVKIKGFNRHEDFNITGVSIPMQLAYVDISILKDMNCNAYRTCHYPNDERFLDLCDENGILVWEESHARGLEIDQMNHPNFMSQSLECIEEMIDSHYNHPSIIIWGILNECASECIEAKDMYKELIDKIKSMDISRPVTYACNKHFKDVCLDLVDIISINTYDAWYRSAANEEEVLDAWIKKLKWIEDNFGSEKPIILSEFGAGAIYGSRDYAAPRWTEERQSSILKDSLNVYLNRPEIIGTFIWQFADCRISGEEWELKRPRGYNNKGIVDEFRRPKLAYEIVKNIYGKH